MPPQDLEALWSIRFGAIYPTAQGPVAYVVCLGNVWCTLGGTILGRPVFVARSLITHPKSSDLASSPIRDFSVWFTRQPRRGHVIELLDFEHRLRGLSPRTGHAFDEHDPQTGMADDFLKAAILEHGVIVRCLTAGFT